MRQEWEQLLHNNVQGTGLWNLKRSGLGELILSLDNTRFLKDVTVMPLFDSAASAVFELLLRSSEHLRFSAA